MSDFSVISTSPLTYLDPVQGVVNGVLVRVRLVKYDEVHELRVPKMDAALVKAEIEKLLDQRDQLAELSK